MLRRILAIEPFGGENFEHHTFVIDRAPQVMRLAFYPNENLVQMPAPVRIRHPMADIYPAFEQQTLDLAKRQRISDLHHHRQDIWSYYKSFS